MLRTSEPEKNSKLAEAMIKLVTGGEQIQARISTADFFKFYPQFKLTMSATTGRRFPAPTKASGGACGWCRSTSDPESESAIAPDRQAAARGLRHSQPAARWPARLVRQRPDRAGGGHQGDGGLSQRLRSARPLPASLRATRRPARACNRACCTSSTRPGASRRARRPGPIAASRWRWMSAATCRASSPT
jgi:hypothetical protein